MSTDLTQCQVLAERFPWAREECAHCGGKGRFKVFSWAGQVLAVRTCPACDSLGYLPLGENDMLAAVQAECARRNWCVVHWDDDSYEIYLGKYWKLVQGWGEQGDTLFAAFLKAAEGETV